MTGAWAERIAEHDKIKTTGINLSAFMFIDTNRVETLIINCKAQFSKKVGVCARSAGLMVYWSCAVVITRRQIFYSNTLYGYP